MKRATTLILAALLLCMPDVSDARGRVDSRVNARVFGPDWSEIVLNFTDSSGISNFLAKHSSTFTRASDQYVWDYDAVLQKVTTNAYALRGARLSGGEWYDTDASGNKLSSVSGFAVWPSETNSLEVGKYRGSGVTTWDTVDAGISADTSGLYGIDNTLNSAVEIGESSGADALQVFENVALADDTKWNAFSCYMKKDSDTSRYPHFYVYIQGGAVRARIGINTSTGAYYVAESGGTYAVGVEHIVDSSGATVWYRPWIALKNTGAGTANGRLYIFPARANDWGEANDNTATGSVVVDWIQQEYDRSRPTAPIVGAQTIALSDFDVTDAADLIEDDRGAVEVVFAVQPQGEWGSHIEGATILGDDASDVALINASAANSGVSVYDGTNTVTGPAGSPADEVHAALRWWGTSMQLIVNGVAGTVGTYDGSWGISTLAVNETGPFTIKEINFFPGKEKTEAYWVNRTN